MNPTAESMYRYIIRFKRLHAGDSPSRREIMHALELPSVSMVQHHLLALEAAGRIVRPKRGQARMIQIPGAEWRFDEVTSDERRVASEEKNKCALSEAEEGAELPGEEKKVGERLGELGVVAGL